MLYRGIVETPLKILKSSSGGMLNRPKLEIIKLILPRWREHHVGNEIRGTKIPLQLDTTRWNHGETIARDLTSMYKKSLVLCILVNSAMKKQDIMGYLCTFPH